MADYGFKDAMSAIDQMIAQQQSMATQKPTGFFGNVDPAMLGLARGFLSPTRTGGFGESLGLGLAGAEGPLAAMKKQQLDAQNKIQELQLARAKLAMEAPYYQSRADYYAAGGANGGALSPTQQRLNLNEEIAMLDNTDASELGITEDQRLDLLKQKRRQKLQLDKLIGAPTSDGETKTEKPPEKPTEKSLYQKGKELLGFGGDEGAAASAETKKTPPKDYPDAKLGAGGHWYVIRDGKPYRVEE